MGKNKSKAKQLNYASYWQYYNRLSELSMVMFEWKNLPKTIDTRFLEYTLFKDGKAVIFKDEVLGWLALPVSTGGELNVYRVPKKRRAYANNGYQKNLDDTNSVIIYNNYTRTNSLLDVELFSRRLSNMDRAIDVNINSQKTPVLITCSEQQRLTMKKAYEQYEGNEPFIFGNSDFDSSSLKVFTTGGPFVADKIRQEKIQTWNEALTYFGISNTNITKKERLISDEVIRSQGGVIASRYSRLEMRRIGCEELANLCPQEFGGATCDYRDDFREVDDEVMLSGDSGSGDAKTIVTDIRTR